MPNSPPGLLVLGRPVEVAPWRLAVVLVLQHMEGLTDRQAAHAVRRCIDWKYLLGLELTESGFDFTLLHDFRDRILTQAAEHHLLDTLLAALKARGLLVSGGKQRSDARHVLAAIRTLNRLECVGEAMRQVLNVLATVAPHWLRTIFEPAWVERYGARFADFRLSSELTKRPNLCQIGTIPLKHCVPHSLRVRCAPCEASPGCAGLASSKIDADHTRSAPHRRHHHELAIEPHHRCWQPGRCPQIRTTADGTSVANFRIATNEYMGRVPDGSAKFHTEWHSIVAWGPLAEAVAKRLEKGCAVYVEGVLRTRAFEDKNGEQRRFTEIKATRVQFLDLREIDDPWADADPADVEDSEA